MTDQTPALDAALNAFQEAILVVPLDGENDYFNSRYVTLPNLARRITPVLREHGLMFKFRTETSDRDTFLVTTLVHLGSGEAETSRMRLPDGNPQAIGSALTYFRRYTMLIMTGLVADGDDDAEAAMGRGSNIPVQRTQGRPQNVQMMERNQYDALMGWKQNGTDLNTVFWDVLKRPATANDMTFDEAARVLQFLHDRENRKS